MLGPCLMNSAGNGQLYHTESDQHIASVVAFFTATWSFIDQLVTICTTTFNIRQFYVLPTQCIYVFCVDLRTKRLFPYTALTDLLYNRVGMCLLRYWTSTYNSGYVCLTIWTTMGKNVASFLWQFLRQILFSTNTTIFGAFEKFRKATIRSSCLSVLLSVRMDQLGSHWIDFLWNLVLEHISKIYRENSSLIKSWKE